MANRVLINASGIKLSKPGVNVLTAGVSGLNFDSQYPVLSVYTRGQLTGWGNRTVSLGKTFPTVPLVVFERVIGNHTVPMGIGGFSFEYMQEMEDIDGLPIGWNSAGATASVSTSSITYSSSFVKVSNSTPNPPNLIFRYTVFDYNL